MKSISRILIVGALLVIVAALAYKAYDEAHREVTRVEAKIDHAKQVVKRAEERAESVFRSAGTGMLPDRSLTPGDARSVSVDELCHTSTKLVRNVPHSLKMKVYREYGMKTNHELWCDTAEKCEIDHEISLEIGGSNDIKNLWPQPYEGAWNAHQKDILENKLHALICVGSITMQEAQSAISTDWIAAYKKYVEE